MGRTTATLVMGQGSKIKARLIRPPMAPSVCIFFFDREMKQEMDSPFLVFNLVAGTTGLEVKGDTRNLIHQERDDRKMAAGFIGREERQSGSGGNCFAEFNGPH